MHRCTLAADDRMDGQRAHSNPLCIYCYRYSGSDICNLIADSLLQPIREIQTAEYWRTVTDEGGAIAGWLPCLSSDHGAVKMAYSSIPPADVS